MLFSETHDQGSPRKSTIPSPSYMSNDQFAAYLSDLRNNRTVRPGGARPPPLKSQQGTKTRSSQDESYKPEPTNVSDQLPSASTSEVSPPKIFRKSQLPWLRNQRNIASSQGAPSPSSEISSISLKPQEEIIARDSVREETDTTQEPADPVLDQASQEASYLIRQHQEGYLPLGKGPYRYKSDPKDISDSEVAKIQTSSPIPLEDGPENKTFTMGQDEESGGKEHGKTALTSSTEVGKPKTLVGSGVMKSYGRMGPRTMPFSRNSTRRKSSLKRNISGEVCKPFSADQIWEEPKTSGRESVKHVLAPGLPKIDSVSQRDSLGLASTPASNLTKSPLLSIDIHKNPPTRSRNPSYVTNCPSLSPPKSVDITPRKSGVEVRADYIKDATSMRLRDRSAKLPTPTAVANDPGRPIVSFDKNWKPPQPKDTKQYQDNSGLTERHTVSTNNIKPMQDPPQPPVIQLTIPEPTPSTLPATASIAQPIPQIIIEDDPITELNSDPTGHSQVACPQIVIENTEEPSKPPRMSTSTTLSQNRSRPLPVPQSSSTSRKQHQHQLPRRSDQRGADPNACHECGYAIQGRFVRLAGCTEQFHPKCFRCYACGTGLEALEISPEPDNYRQERLDRIKRRGAGEVLDEEPGKTMMEDGDERLRFFCHLDWHEMFAPKCKHCKTSILGEHIMALGERWHPGHFFCAECGDPFEDGMTHLERDGYAYCIKCQTQITERRAPKCRMCKTPVIGQYIIALGGEWHDHCFRCASCKGAFDDGQIFPKETDEGRMVIVCTNCRISELKL